MPFATINDVRVPHLIQGTGPHPLVWFKSRLETAVQAV
jgi:hypothetical protein